MKVEISPRGPPPQLDESMDDDLTREKDTIIVKEKSAIEEERNVHEVSQFDENRAVVDKEE